MAGPFSLGASATSINWKDIGKGLAGLAGVGALVGGVGSLFGKSGGVSVYKSNLINKYSEGLQEKYLRNYYSNARKSLNDAGYNPMLAYMQTPSGGAANAVANEGNEVGQRAQAIGNIIQGAIANADIKNTNADTVKTMAEAETELERPELIRQQAIGQGLSNILSQKDVDWYEKMRQADIYMKYATGYGAITGSNAQQTMADTDKEIRNFEKLRYMDWKKRHPYQEGFLYGAGQYTGTIGKVFSGTAGTSFTHKR